MPRTTRIVYYTSGVSGLGRLVRGIAIGLALGRRAERCQYTVVHSSPQGPLIEGFGLQQRAVPMEGRAAHSQAGWRRSELYAALAACRPDVLIVDLMWFPLHHMLDALPGQKLLILRQVEPRFFCIPGVGGTDPGEGAMELVPDAYDEIITIEPFATTLQSRRIQPVVIRNPEEILPREVARAKLGITANKACLVSLSGPAEHLSPFDDVASQWQARGYQVIVGKNGDRFPVVDYFNAFDKVVTTAGYNAFWETRLFEKDAEYVTIPRQFEDQSLRVSSQKSYQPPLNGADELAALVLGA